MTILVFGGTTEGRLAAETLDRAGKQFYYSTKCSHQTLDMTNGIRLSGGLDKEGILKLISEKEIGLIVDAAHPFASELHENIQSAATEAGIDTIRFERKELNLGEVTVCDDYADAIERMKNTGVKRVLALTGVQTIGKLKGFEQSGEIFFRILNREDSKEKARAEGLGEERIVYYTEEDAGGSKAIAELKADAIITKESGESGRFSDKMAAARDAGIKIFVVKRPGLKEATDTVYGVYGLRRAVERLLPGFFDLRTGFTTGSCATASAKASLECMLSGIARARVEFELPDGEPMEMPITESRQEGGIWICTTIKDAGDDPDVTDGCKISARVKRTEGDEIVITGGEGIGTVTLPGLDAEVGGAAINRVPREMIISNLRKIYPRGGLEVELSVENGEEIAKRTFNEKVGVVNGISILGTTGIVMPFSHEAFVESIRREISVAMAAGSETLVINSGAKSEKILHEMYKNLPSYAFIHYGNAIGETLEAAEKAGVKTLIMGIMIGKAVKMAEGYLNTHSHNVRMNKNFIAEIGRETQLPKDITDKIRGITLARELWDIVNEKNYPQFYERIMNLCKEKGEEIFSGKLKIIIVKG